MRHAFSPFLPFFGILALAVAPGVARAQGATLRIVVTDSASAAPLAGAIVELRSATGALLRTLATDRRGEVRTDGVTASRPTIRVRIIGYRPKSLVVDLNPGENRRVLVQISRDATILQPLVVTVSRIEQDPLTAPVAVSVVEAATLARQPAATTIDYIAVLPEAQVLSGGLMTRRYTTRGPNNGTSANVRTMTDFRTAITPGVNHNVDYLSSTIVADIARVELIRGQGTVGYGPNASRGVLHFITRSALDEQGTTLAFAGGERSTVQASLGHAARLGDHFGLRLSGEYFGGRDWLPPGIAQDSALGGTRLDRARRYRANARADWEPDDRTRVMLSGGVAQASVYDPVTYSGFAALIDGARQWHLQGRFVRDELQANLFYTRDDLGDGLFPAISLPFVDHSATFTAQLQHGVAAGPGTALRYGVDLSRTLPSSDSTLFGGFEGRANLTEIGGFVSASTQLSPRLELLLAGRLDYNSNINNVGFAPWAALVWSLQPAQAVRVSVSRSFTSPGAIDAWGDFAVSGVGPLPYSVRFVGSGPGRTFRRDCGDGLCMRSPFNPAGAGGDAAYLPADATTQWGAAVALLQAQGVDISALPAPTGNQVGSVLRTLNLATGEFDPTNAADVVDVGRVERRWVTQVELGYTGVINDRLRLGVDLYYRRNNQIASAEQVVTPNVFLEDGSLTAYLGQFLPAADAAAVAGALAEIPLGTVTPVESNSPTDLALGQFRVRGIRYWGASLDIEAALTSQFSANLAYGWMSDDLILGDQGAQVVFNNPKNHFTFGLDYDNARAGLSAGVQGRWLASYPATNGAATVELPSYTLVDVVVGYRILGTGLALSLTTYNLFDDRHQELPGAPVIGRFVLGGIRATF